MNCPGHIWSRVAMIGLFWLASMAVASAQSTAPDAGDDAFDQFVQASRSAMMSDPVEAQSHAESAEALIESLPARQRNQALATVRWLQSEALTRLGRPEEGHPLAVEALEALGQRPSPNKLLADIYTSLGRVEKVLGEHGQALERYQSAYEIYRTIGDTRSESIALQSIASIYSDAQQYDRAVDYFQNALDRYQDNAVNLAAYNNMANALTQMGEFAQAAAAFDHALDLADAMESPMLRARILNNFANMYIFAEDFDAADAAIDAAFSALAGEGEVEWERFLWAVRAQIAHARGESNAAIRHIERAFRGVDPETTSQNYIETHGAAVDIYAATNRWRDAFIHLRAYKRLTDERSSFAASANAALMGAQFDFAEQDLEIQRLRNATLEQELALSSARIRQAFFILFGVSSIGIAVVCFFYFRNRLAREKAAALSDALYTDTMTGLPSRAALVRDMAAAAKRIERDVTAIVFRIRRSEHLQTALGFDRFSRLEQAVASRIRVTAETSHVYRVTNGVHGILSGAETEEEAGLVVKEVLRAFDLPVRIDNVDIDVAILAGYSQHDEPELAVKQALIAVNQGREARKSAMAFDAGRYGDPSENLTLMSDMIAATRNGAMSLHYQPKLNLRTGRYESVEALARWHDPARGYMPPDRFIPQAEEMGYIKPLTEWALTRVVEDQRRVVGAREPVQIAVNISAALVQDQNFARKAVSIVATSVGPISFEITETAVMENPEKALENIHMWHKAGIRISIDDYGAGQSSLAYLKSIPAHELKLDRQFIKDLNTSARGRLLIKSTVDLAHNLGLELVAEGVETEADLAALKLLGCDWAQGYALCKPVERDQLIRFLGQQRQAASAPQREPRAL